jgi:hypothetical protein
MRTVLRLIPWLVLAGVGAWLSGLWGFLAVAILFGLYYGLLRPRALLGATAEKPAATRENEEQRDVALAAAVFDRAAKASAPKQSAKPKGG